MEHPSREGVQFVLDVLEHGADIRYEGERESMTVAPNLASVKEQPEAVTAYLEAEVTAGRIAGPFNEPPWPGFKTSPIGLVPKGDSGSRLINHLSFGGEASINGSIGKWECKLGSFEEAVSLVKKAGQGCKLIKVDVKAAFRLIPVRQQDLHLLGMKWDGHYFVDLCLPFGLRSSPPIWERFSRMLRWLLINKAECPLVTHYVDDFLVVVPAGKDADAVRRRVLRTFEELGVPVSTNKLVGPTERLEFLGHELDSVSMTCQVAPTKKEAALAIIQHVVGKTYVERKEVESLLGRLFFLTRVVRQGRAFLARCIEVLRGKRKRRIKMTEAVKDDLKWWTQFLPRWSGITLTFDDTWVDSDVLALYTDASERGAGAYFGGEWFSHPWSEEELKAAWRSKRLSLAYLELLAVGHALSTWGDKLQGRQVRLHSDNKAAVFAMGKWGTRDTRLMELVRAIVMLTIEKQFVLRLVYVKSIDNTFADPLSRLDLALFQARCPIANQVQSEMIPIRVTGW